MYIVDRRNPRAKYDKPMQPAMRIEKPGTMMMQIRAELAKASELAVRRRKVNGSL
jgi:hypothetical protein